MPISNISIQSMHSNQCNISFSQSNKKNLIIFLQQNLHLKLVADTYEFHINFNVRGNKNILNETT